MMNVRSESVGGLLLVLVAFVILFFSLRAPNAGYLSGAEARVEQQSLAKLMKNEWIPGHPLYPVLMLRDRIAVWTTIQPEDRALLFVELAEHRRATATLLLERKEEGLALTTIAKSQAYLLQAGGEIEKVGNPEQKNRVGAVTMAEIQRFFAEVELWKTSIEDRYKSPLDVLVNQLRTLQTDIQQQLSNTK